MLKKIATSLEKLLDHDSSAENAVETGISEFKNGFNISDSLYEIDNLSYAFQDQLVDASNIERLVEKIACYFEIVFLIDLLCSKTATTQAKARPVQQLESAYIYGKKINVIENRTTPKIPEVPVYKVYKTGAFRFLEKFKIHDLDQQKKMNCYLIRISKKYALVLVGRSAEPWSKIRIEKLQHALMKINFTL